MRIRQSAFEFEIDNFESKALPAGTCISSPTFNAGGYDWFLAYYPRGNKPQNQVTHVSLFLVLKSEADDITAHFSFHVNYNGGSLLLLEMDNTFSGRNPRGGSEYFLARNDIALLHRDMGTIVVWCNISLLGKQKIVQNASDGLCEHIGKLWEKQERFDVTFEVEGQNISAHRLILAARSPVFEATFFGTMAEANMERIKINEMKPEVFKALLHFVYTDELAIDKLVDHKRDGEILSVELLQGLFAAANRYALDKLTLLCEKQLVKILSVDIVAKTLILADQHSRILLKTKCLEFASAPENFSLVALTEGYLQIMPGHPALFAELSEKVKSSSPFKDKLAKKQKTSN